MHLWQLRTFQVVSRVLHFTRASEELNLSQPAVSHQIKSLEAEFGAPLFLREKNKVSLTKAGIIVRAHADKILNLAGKMQTEINESAGKKEASLTLSAVLRFLENPFPTVYQTFKKIHPDLKLQFRSEPESIKVVEGVRSGIFDVGFMATLTPDPNEFDSLVLGEFKMVPVVGAGHKRSGKSTFDVKSLENEHWALFENGDDMRGLIEQRFSAAGIKPKSVYATNDGSVICDLVSSGDFISIMPSIGISSRLATGKLINVSVPELEFSLSVFVFWKKNRCSKAIESFLKFIIEQDLPGIQKNDIIEADESK